MEAAKILAKNEIWNDSLSRLYYACFYAVLALLLEEDIKPKTHKGVKVNFLNIFVKTGQISKEYGKFFTHMHDMRGETDYADYVEFEPEIILTLIPETEKFIEEIKSKISIS
ncbi:MAG: HEPN domain-containing protein [Bacteroidales bacterium]|nr:HEPN domain-containing protein [Bacteroidales bacterium]